MYRTILLGLALGAIACKDDKTDDTSADDSGGHTGETGDTGEGPGVFEDFINTIEPATGEMSCYDGASWITETADAACQTTAAIAPGETEDFATGNAVDGAIVEIWYGDSTGTSADLSTTADASGLFTGSLPVCQPVAVKVSDTEGNLVPTYEFHSIHGASATASVTALSVEMGTYLTIPSLFGVTIDDDKGVIAGSARDCFDDVLIGAQVVVKDADGVIPGSLAMGYTSGGIPSRTLTATSDDGVWIAMNVPPGTYTAEMYVSDGAGGQTLVSTAVVEAFATSVSIASTHYGRTTGYNLPDSCLLCMAE